MFPKGTESPTYAPWLVNLSWQILLYNKYWK